MVRFQYVNMLAQSMTDKYGSYLECDINSEGKIPWKQVTHQRNNNNRLGLTESVHTIRSNIT